MKAIGGVFQHRNILNFNLKVLRMWGYWQPENCSRCVKILYRMYTFTVLGLIISHVMAEIGIIVIMARKGNVKEMVNGSALFFLRSSFMMKVLYLVKNKQQILPLVDAMDTESFKPKNNQQNLILTTHSKRMIIFSYIFVAMGVATCILFGVIRFTHQGEIKLPLSGWYPFQNQLFAVLYIYNLVAETSLAMCNISIDCIFVCLLAHMCNQMELLSNCLRSIKKLCEEILVKRKYSSTNYQQELQKLMDEMIIECIVHHRNVLR